MRYQVDLTTPEAVARQLNTVNPDADNIPDAVRDPADGQYADFWNYVTDQCHAVSAEIMKICNRSFVPYTAAYNWRYRDAVYLDGNLWLKEDLLLSSSFEIGGVTIDPASFSGIPSDVLPYMYLDVDYSTVSGVSTSWGAGYALTGTWGYVENLTQAWTVVQTGFSCTSSETTLPVADANAFETLQYIRCQTEMMQITARNVTDDELTVVRGVNGTTAAIHTAQPLEKFNVVPAIAQAATQWVAYRYIRRTPVGQTVQLPDGSVVIANGPEGVMKTLAPYMRPVAPRSVRARPQWWGR
jgi:hypothetical protein